MGSSVPLRRSLLRTWGHGESHQGTTILVCRSRQRRNDACQSGPSLLVGDRLSPCRGFTSAGADRNRNGDRPGEHDSSSATQDRCARTYHCPQNLDLDGFRLSLPKPLSSRLGCSALLKSRCLPLWFLWFFADVSLKLDFLLHRWLLYTIPTILFPNICRSSRRPRLRSLSVPSKPLNFDY